MAHFRVSGLSSRRAGHRITGFCLVLLIAFALGCVTGITPASAGTDDYPTSIAGCHYASNPGGPAFTCDLKDSAQDSLIDPWGEDNRECTSFVAWRLHARNGFEMPFHDNAYLWQADAQARGYTVDMNPAVGSVAWWNVSANSPTGHVAWVESVSSDASQVTVEQYNANDDGTYSEQAIATSTVGGFIHFKDLPSTTPWGGVGTASFYGGDTLAAGRELDSNQYLLSADARFALILQTDGNLVLYSKHSIWQSGTSGSGATRLVMQTDGNLVLYTAASTLVWSSGTGGTGPGHLTVQTDGNVVTYNDSTGNPTWQSMTGGNAGTTSLGGSTPDRLNAGQELDASGQYYLLSSDKRYGLLLQSDGTLVLHGSGYHVLWSHHNDGATRLVMQADGNLVLYNVNTALWWTGTGGSGTNRVVMQTDGNLVEYTASNTPTWWTGTSGP